MVKKSFNRPRKPRSRAGNRGVALGEFRRDSSLDPLWIGLVALTAVLWVQYVNRPPFFQFDNPQGTP